MRIGLRIFKPASRSGLHRAAGPLKHAHPRKHEHAHAHEVEPAIAAALRVHLAREGPDFDFVPDAGLSLVGADDDEAEFIATRADGRLVFVRLTNGGGWSVAGWGDCTPRLVQAEGIGTLEVEVTEAGTGAPLRYPRGRLAAWLSLRRATLAEAEAELSCADLLRSRAPVEHDDSAVDGFVGRIGEAVAIDVAKHTPGDGSERHQSEGQLFRFAATERDLHLRDWRRIEIDGQR